MKIYERYHAGRKNQKRVITNNNYTYRYILPIIETSINNRSTVLDIGCGTGTIDLYLAQKGMKVTGIDISKKAIKIAKTNAKKFRFDKKIKFIVSEFPSTSIRGKYDLVICTEVLEHLPDDSLAVRKIYKLLNKNGIAILSSPLGSSVLYRLGLAKKFDKEVGHLRRYSEKSYSDLIKKAGFKIISVKKGQGLFRDILFLSDVGGFFLKFANKFSFVSDLFNKIDKLFLPLGASDIIVVAKNK